MNELYEKYPQFKDVDGIDLQSWEICPVDVESQHDGKKYTVTSEAAEKFASQMMHTPLMYAESTTNLPKTHKDAKGKRRTIGNALNGYIVKDEEGIDRLMADYVMYTDSNQDIIKDIEKFKDNVSASWEINDADEQNGDIYNGDYNGTSVINKEDSAYRHHALLVADKTNTDVDDTKTANITYYDIIKKVIGSDYQTKLDGLQSQLDTAKTEYELKIQESEEKINGLEIDNTELRMLNNRFSSLI